MRDGNHVDDCVNAWQAAAGSERAHGHVYNSGRNEVAKFMELASKLNSGRPGATCELIPLPADRQAIAMGDDHRDRGRIHAELVWQLRVEPHPGLTRTVAYERASNALI